MEARSRWRLLDFREAGGRSAIVVVQLGLEPISAREARVADLGSRTSWRQLEAKLLVCGAGRKSSEGVGNTGRTTRRWRRGGGDDFC